MASEVRVSLEGMGKETRSAIGDVDTTVSSLKEELRTAVSDLATSLSAARDEALDRHASLRKLVTTGVGLGTLACVLVIAAMIFAR